MLTVEERQQFVELLGRAEWPLPLEVFFAFCEKNIVASVDLALIRYRSGPEVLMTLRPSSDPYFAGLWHIPGGIIVPGETALSTIEKRVLKPDVGISLPGDPEFLIARDILMGPAGRESSPRGQEAYRLFQYVLRDGDTDVPEGPEKKFYRLDDIPEALVAHQRPSIEKLRAVHGA